MKGLRSLFAATLLVAMGASVAPAQAQFQIDLTIDPTEFVDPQSGLVTITGTVTCSEPTDFVDLFVAVIQPIGRKDAVEGSVFEGDLECDEDPTPFEFTVFAFNGRFGPGQAIVLGDVFACGVSTGCDGDEVTTTVRLRPQRTG